MMIFGNAYNIHLVIHLVARGDDKSISRDDIRAIDNR